MVADLWSPSFRHEDKNAEFVTLCKSLHVTDPVCDRAWTLWKTVQESMDEAAVRTHAAVQSFHCTFLMLQSCCLPWKTEISSVHYFIWHQTRTVFISKHYVLHGGTVAWWLALSPQPEGPGFECGLCGDCASKMDLKCPIITSSDNFIMIYLKAFLIPL